MPDYVKYGSPWYEMRNSIKKIVIEDGITRVGNWAFSSCSNVTEVVLPDSVIAIGSIAFAGCKKLVSINLDDNNPNYCLIDGVLFTKDKSTIIYYPSSMEGDSYTIPNSVTSIGQSAFWGNQNLKAIEIPDSVTSIGGSAFRECMSLETITIPKDIPNIVGTIFWGSEKLTSITVDEDDKYYYTEDGILFSKDKKTLINYPSGKEGAVYVIPDGVTTIATNAFTVNPHLKAVEIPKSVTIIGSYSLYTDVTDIYYQGTEEEWDEINIEPEEEQTALTTAKLHFPEYTITMASADKKSLVVKPVGVEAGSTIVLATFNGKVLSEIRFAKYDSDNVPFTVEKDYDTAKVFVWDGLVPVCEVEIVK